jgi:hypothetical protein
MQFHYKLREMMELTNKLSHNTSISGNKKDDDNTETQELFRHREKKVNSHLKREKLFPKVVLFLM